MSFAPDLCSKLGPKSGFQFNEKGFLAPVTWGAQRKDKLLASNLLFERALQFGKICSSDWIVFQVGLRSLCPALGFATAADGGAGSLLGLPHGRLLDHTLSADLSLAR